MPNIIVEARAIEMSYRMDGAELPVLSGVEMRIAEGESIAVLGPSGAGKSTLLHIVGLLETPTGGSLMFDGQDARSFSERRRAEYRLKRLGFVFQFHHLLREFTALENVMLPALIAGEDPRAARERAAGLLEQVGLGQRLNHKPGQLSGGEQQRVAVARALVNKPALILADEPTGNLDRNTSLGLRELLQGVCATSGAALLLVTHNEELAKLAGSILRLRDGRLEAG